VDLLIVDVFARRWTGVGPTQFAQEDRPKPSMVAVTVSPVDDVGRDQRPIGPPDVRARILTDHAHALATAQALRGRMQVAQRPAVNDA